VRTLSLYDRRVNRHAWWLVALTFCPARPAEAICGFVPEVSVLPFRGLAAPTNTHVWLRLRSDFRSTGIACGQHPSPECQRARRTFELRTAPTSAARPLVVSSTTSEIVSGDSTFIELTPREPLRPSTAYEVWTIDDRGKAEPLVLGAFTTGDRTDDSAPEWAGITGAAMFHAPPPGKISLSGECGQARLLLDLAVPTDDPTPPSALRAAIWVTSPKSAIDYSKPPQVYEPLDYSSNPVRSIADVIAGNADGYDDDLPIVDGKSPLRIGVRIVDLAGNASTPSETVVR